MSLFGLLNGPDINEGVSHYKSIENAILLDVRTKEEYKEGHIEGSINIPLQEIQKAAERIEKDAIVFVYCLSGARSRQATQQLKKMGYSNVTNIGGINRYRGKVVR